MKKISVILLFVVFVSSFSYSQLGVKISDLPPEQAKGYLKPLSTFFGTYFNSGTYYDADVPELFGFKFNIIGMWSIIPESQKTYTPKIEGVDNIKPTATVFGNKASYYLDSKGFYTFPTGLALNSIPSGIVQISGSTFNTELMLRFFPSKKFNDAKVGLFGFGLKHEISSYIPLCPIDISVQILYNNLNFKFDDGDPVNFTEVKSNNFAFNVHASKTFAGMFIAYAGLQYENSSTDVTYFFEDADNFFDDVENKKYDVELDGDNKIRFTLGGAIRLGFFVMNTDVNLTRFTTFTLGLSFDF